ncbi:MAG: hypothetical protein ACYS0I_03070 [Planctomycetota bacterium]|jgi:hypothetical protein
MEHKKLLCQQVQEYIDGLSQRQLQEEIESSPEYEHIRQCATCREYFERAKSLSEKLEQWSVPTPKRNITAGVMTQIAQLERDTKVEHFSLWSRLPALFIYRLKVPVGVAAAVFVILTVSLFLNITRLDTYPDSKERMQAKTDQSIPEEIKYAYRIKQKTYPVSIQSGSNGQMCLFGVSPEAAPTPIVIILGIPGVIPIETTPRPVSVNLSNQRL